ncbi:DNA polymerase III subunit gamma/tau [Terricaulis silvestris]|uniref:DNA polymerase III subunit gamma/tau n=1 Tax=Terricaulis silvestris TaxID=2686094 RepID=A0A6I6MM70_9CAUL|nr:DNA polymerase III subunit gamma/tau [Terricaulis silvestris]QGZ94418.1 DNA polymerase III subunit tau [Terricaulis silvestris]
MSESNSPGLFGDEPDGGYVVLARKYRPKTFADLIGQEAMVRTIANSFALGRIPHATMLTGVRGVGKTTTARLLARALNYKSGAINGPSVELDPMGENCQAIMESRHPDVFEMDAASRTGINDIREILDSVRYAPVMARYKVYIIDEVHMLSTQAFNGLLKTLEEPPPHVKFIFATTEIRKVPVTVLSRCQRFDLKRIDSERLAEHLASICAKEGVKVDTDALALIARAAEGSARDGLSLLDQALVQKPGASVSAADVRDMLGLADRGRVLDVFEAIAKGDAKAAITDVRNQYDSGADPTLILRDLLDVGHEAARAQALGADARIIGGADWVERVRGLAEQLSPAQLSRLWQMLLKALEEAGKAPDPIAAVEMAMVRLCAAQSLPPPEEAARLLRDGASWTAGVSPAGSAPSAQKSPTVNAAPAQPVANKTAGETPAVQAQPPAHTVDSPFQTFEDVTKAVAEERDIELELALERLKVTRFSPAGEVVYIAHPDQPRDLVRQLKAFLEERTPFEWTIRSTTESTAPIESLADRRKREEARALEELKRQPFVAEALKHFPGAEIAKVTQPVEDGGGDVAPFPQRDAPAPSPARKKEADR